MVSKAQESYQNRASRTVPVNRRRQRAWEWEDTRRPAWVAWVSILCIIALLVGVLALSTSDRVSAPQNINGDQLGPFDVATQREYEVQADTALDAMEGDAPRWALLTPKTAVQPTALSPLVDDPQMRVSVLLVGPVQWVLPEPARGQQRIDVLRNAENTMAAGAGLRPQDIRVEGVLIRARPQELRALRQRPEVLAVEPADPGAVYGRIGLRPSTPS